MSAALCRRQTGAQGSYQTKAREADRKGCFCASSFYRRNQNNQTPPNVIRRHREDIFHTTCTVCKDFDRRDSSTTPAASLGMTITSVTLSGASAESKGLEFAEHSPVRFARALDISPSRPLGFARGDSFRCHVERRASAPKSKHLDLTEHPPLRPARVHARPTVGIPRLRLRSE